MQGQAPVAIRRRVAKAREAWQQAGEAIGTIGPDTALFVLTRGQISMIDVIREVVRQLGQHGEPLRASVWTWCIADYEVEAFEWFFQSGLLEEATLVIDRSAEQRNVALIDRWRARYGEERVRVCMNHAKVATVASSSLRVAIRGSMNLNFNPRFEQFDLTVNDGVYDLVREVEAQLPVLRRWSSRAEALEASQVSQAFADQQLAIFEGVHTWAK